MNRVAVIGAGPAGLIASTYSALKGNKTILFEKNEKIGKKLFITGKGRCNITNSSDIQELIDKISVNKNFMYSGFYSFTNEDIIKILNKKGVKTKIERGNRVFPESDKSSDVIKGFEKLIKESGVLLKLKTEIKNINLKDDKFIVEYKTNNEYKHLVKKDEFDSVIICTGGASYPLTGSTGDGYCFAKNFGHNIVKIKPALVPIEIKDEFVKDLQGLSLKNVKITAKINEKKIYEDFGEMIFTHFGISGPIVLSMSNYINKYSDENIKIFIDLKPALNEEKLKNRIIKDFEKYSKKQFKNSLNDLFPKKMIPVIIKMSKIDGEKFVNQITKEERNALVKLIKNFKLNFKGFRPIKEAIVTAGGVDTLEIDPSTMESKKIKKLYFAGEVLDLHAETGGYNLQIAYSTGYLAGINS